MNVKFHEKNFFQNHDIFEIPQGITGTQLKKESFKFLKQDSQIILGNISFGMSQLFVPKFGKNGLMILFFIIF
jgi:hypothetical protein